MRRGRRRSTARQPAPIAQVAPPGMLILDQREARQRLLSRR
jgi:hypothetical protein